jgi:hypothetical protein
VPPLTLENAGALVPGGVTASDIEKERKAMQATPPNAPVKTLEVKVLRNFQGLERKLHTAGEVLTLPRVFALEMIAANKVELMPGPEATKAATDMPADKPAEKASGKKEK